MASNPWNGVRQPIDPADAYLARQAEAAAARGKQAPPSGMDPAQMAQIQRAGEEAAARGQSQATVDGGTKVLEPQGPQPLPTGHYDKSQDIFVPDPGQSPATVTPGPTTTKKFQYDPGSGAVAPVDTGASQMGRAQATSGEITPMQQALSQLNGPGRKLYMKALMASPTASDAERLKILQDVLSKQPVVTQDPSGKVILSKPPRK